MKMTRKEPLLLSTHDKWSLNGLGIKWIGTLAVEHYGGYNTIVVSPAITCSHKSGLKSSHKINRSVPSCLDACLASSVFAD